MKTAATIQERLSGALWGAVTGDALGVPVEFQSRATLTANPVTGMRAFGTHCQPAGTWSDDSSLLLCTVDSLAACGGFDPVDLAARFVRWGQNGYCTPHGGIFDIGVATSDAIANLREGVWPEEAGRDDEYSNGNCSLMRILPVGLWGSVAPGQQSPNQEPRPILTQRAQRTQRAAENAEGRRRVFRFRARRAGS
jgi:ADP-ribosylglycohydrolase